MEIEMERDNVSEEEEERKIPFELLCGAAIKGEPEILIECPHILDQVTSNCVAKDNHPLHIGALLGHFEFVKEILNIKPELTRAINSKGLSPLHVASEKGHYDVVRLLLEKDGDVRFLRDTNGRTPLHLAAMKGRVNVLEVLVGAKKTAAWILTAQGEPILHICAKHSQFEALKKLVDFVRDEEFLNLKDSDDNTILHVLIDMGKFEVIKYLMDKERGLDVNSTNVHGSTAMDILPYGNIPTTKLLIRAGAKLPNKSRLPRQSSKIKSNNFGQGLIVVAILITTVTFQAMTSPPGVFFQDDRPNATTTASNKTGTVAYKFKDDFISFIESNTLGFNASLGVIMLLLIDFARNEGPIACLLLALTSIAVIFMSKSYSTVSDTVAKGMLSSKDAGDFDKTKKLSEVTLNFLYIGSGMVLCQRLLIWPPFGRTFIWYLCRYQERISPTSCFQLMKLGIKHFFGWILRIIYKLRCFKVQSNGPSGVHNTGGEAGP